MEHFKVRFRYKTGIVSAGTICDTWIDEDRKYLRCIYFNSFNEEVESWFVDLKHNFWDNIEFLYEINEGKDWIYYGVF